MIKALQNDPFRPFLYQLEALTSIHRHGNVFIGLKLSATCTQCNVHRLQVPGALFPIEEVTHPPQPGDEGES